MKKTRPRFVLAILLSVSLTQSSVWAGTRTPIPSDEPPTFSMNPSKISVGTTRVISITISKGDLSDYTVQPPPESTGVTFEKVGDKLFFLSDDNKKINIRVKVDQEAETGIVKIVIEKSDGSDVRTFDLTMSNRINGGPTPDDIKEVDVMPGVLTYDIAKVSFGRRVADLFYAIQLDIGNNTGFDLQLVGVGFKNSLGVPQTDSYGNPLRFAVDANNNPLLDEQGNRLVQALDKDGNPIVINGKPVYRSFKTYHYPTTDHRLVRAAIEFEQLYGRRALAVNLITGIGTLVSGFIPFFHNLSHKANFSSFSSILNGQLKEGFAIAAPDLTVSQLNRLENVSLRDNLIIPNNRSARTIVFFPRRVIALTTDEKSRIDHGDISPLMDKLGELVIVGKPLISFKNREIVVRLPGENLNPQPPAAPEPRGTVSPARSQNADLVVTISGSNLLSVSEVKFGSLNGAIRENTRTQNQMDVVVPANAQTGDVTIIRPNGPPTSVGTVRLPPRAVNVSTRFANIGDDITIEGANLDEVAVVTIGGAAAEIKSHEAGKLVVTVTSENRSGEMLLKATETVSSLWNINQRNVSAGNVTIGPVITGFTPNEAGPGVKVTISGFNFNGVSEVKFGDVAAQFGPKDLSASPQTIEATVPATATTAKITIVTVHDLHSESPDVFTFVPLPEVPDFPTTVVAGQGLTITGTNLGDLKELKIGSVVIPASAIKENTPTKITVTIPAGTINGKIVITTPGGSITSPNVLTITAP